MKISFTKTAFFWTAFLLAILFLNWMYSYSSDDCFYALGGTASADGIPMRLRTLANAWTENRHDGYRPVVHIFVRLFTGCFDKWVFNLANTMMLGLLVCCIVRLARDTSESVGFNTLTLALALVFFVLCKGESYLWCAGSVNYLWAGTGSLAFCLLLRRMEKIDDSWLVVVLYCVAALLAGWLQEAFVLPIGCAIVAHYALNHRLMTAKKAAVFLCYALGIFLLVRIAGRRASTIEPFSIVGFCMTLLKIAVAVKAVWLLLVVYLFSRHKADFIRRNLFLLFIVGASLSMIAIVGFNGERSLWAANLFSIVVLVRELSLSDRIARVIAVVLLSTLGICCCLGYRIKQEFDDFTRQFVSSQNGLCWHNRVNCGPFARFFHQSVYTWEDGGHGKVYGYFHGRDLAPAALSRADYDALVSGSFCIPDNRLPTEVEAYTHPGSNTIVVPLSETAPTPRRVSVEYDLPKGFWEKVKREIASRRRPPVANPTSPREVFVNGRRFAFVSKLPESDPFIRRITFESEDEPLTQSK